MQFCLVLSINYHHTRRGRDGTLTGKSPCPAQEWLIGGVGVGIKKGPKTLTLEIV